MPADPPPGAMLWAGAGRVTARALGVTAALPRGQAPWAQVGEGQSRLSVSVPSPHRAEQGRGLHSKGKGRAKQRSWCPLHPHVLPLASPCDPICRDAPLWAGHAPSKRLCTLCCPFIFSQSALLRQVSAFPQPSLTPLPPQGGSASREPPLSCTLLGVGQLSPVQNQAQPCGAESRREAPEQHRSALQEPSRTSLPHPGISSCLQTPAWAGSRLRAV